LIDHTGWELVFTKLGRYYFHDTVEGLAKWQPPEHLLEYLLDMPHERRDLLFNPHREYIIEEAFEASPSEDEYIVEEEEEEQNEEEEKDGGETEPVYQPPTSLREPRQDPEGHRVAVESFRQFLLSSQLDPFQSWDNIKQTLSADPSYHGIRTERERKLIFDSVCPILVERFRKIRDAKREKAEQQWQETLCALTLVKAPITWTEYNRQIRKESFYQLLNPKAMEKQYRVRLAELRSQSTVYQIPR
jgi:hypothetical protein